MNTEHIKLSEAAKIGVDALPHDVIIWKCHTKVEKYDPALTDEQVASGLFAPIEIVEIEGNLAMYGGVSCLWQCLIGNGTGTGGQSLTFFNNGNAYIGVGDSSTAAAATQTDLQASTNKTRQAMDATYPSHTDGTTSGAASIVFKATFGSGSANYAWAEWGIFNASSGGRMLNRKVESLGTKTTGSWALTITLSLA